MLTGLPMGGAGQIEEMAQGTDARQVRSRRALNAALLSLLVEKPFDQITIREIAGRARVGYATFFRHYPGKEALLADVASAKIAQVLQLVAPILATSDSAALTRALCDNVHDERDLWSALLTGGASGIVREAFLSQARRVEHHIHTRFDWLPPDLVVLFATGGAIDLLGWWLGQDEPMTSEAVAAIMERLIFVPLGSGD